MVHLLWQEVVLMEMALRLGDLQRDTRGIYHQLETGLQEHWNRYLENEMTMMQFLQAYRSLYGVHPTAPDTDNE